MVLHRCLCSGQLHLRGSDGDLYQIDSTRMSWNDCGNNRQWDHSHWSSHSLTASSTVVDCFVAVLIPPDFPFLLSHICPLPSVLHGTILLWSSYPFELRSVPRLSSFLALYHPDPSLKKFTIDRSWKPGIQGRIATKWIMVICNDQSAGLGYSVLAWATFM